MRALLTVTLLCLPLLVKALQLPDFLLTADQQGYRALSEHDTAKAARLFTDNNWQATAYYRAGQYQQAAEAWQKEQSDTAHYNRGNALAQLGEYQQAIAAYQHSLQLNPDNEDARTNLTTLKKWLEEQQEKERQQQEQEQEQEDDKGAAAQKQPPSPIENEQDSKGAEHNEAPSPPADPERSAEQPSEHQQQALPELQQQSSQATDTAQTESQPDASENEQQETEMLEQWLRSVPNDPGELLRRKFLLEKAKRQRSGYY